MPIDDIEDDRDKAGVDVSDETVLGEAASCGAVTINGSQQSRRGARDSLPCRVGGRAWRLRRGSRFRGLMKSEPRPSETNSTVPVLNPRRIYICHGDEPSPVIGADLCTTFHLARGIRRQGNCFVCESPISLAVNNGDSVSCSASSRS